VILLALNEEIWLPNGDDPTIHDSKVGAEHCIRIAEWARRDSKPNNIITKD